MTLLSTARRFATAMSGYDALYAALARSLRCPLVTTNARLAHTATQFHLTVTHVPTSGR
jgi:predicted nucleic acid-binding protein